MEIPIAATVLDLRGNRCPLIVRLVDREVRRSPDCCALEVLGDDPAMVLDLRVWAAGAGWEVQHVSAAVGREIRVGLHRGVRG